MSTSALYFRGPISEVGGRRQPSPWDRGGSSSLVSSPKPKGPQTILILKTQDAQHTAREQARKKMKDNRYRDERQNETMAISE
eukprot:scaffold34989_cov118-Isochrysis_galbana.AAC.3